MQLVRTTSIYHFNDFSVTNNDLINGPCESKNQASETMGRVTSGTSTHEEFQAQMKGTST